MDANTTGKLIETGSKFAGDLVRMAIAHSGKKRTESVASAEYPLQNEALKKLGSHTVVTLHDDGDAMVKSQGKLYVVTTGGTTFEQVGQREAAPVSTESVTRVVPKQAAHIDLPTKEQTTAELKRRLAKELRRAELDLVGGLVIAGRPCTCIEGKHALEIEAAAEELIPEEPDNTVYQDIIQWLRDNQHKVTVAAIASGKFKQEYPRMAAEFRDFRKRVMGTVSSEESTGANLTLDDAKKMAAA